MIQNTWESMLCHSIFMQCFSELIMSMYKYKLTLLDSSSSQTTQIRGTSHMIHKSTVTPDATSGR